jgi:glucuronokinase
MIIRRKSYPRAGLVGNPSDGYFGKTIAFVFKEFHAEVVLYESPELTIQPNTRDHSIFNNIHQLAKDVRTYGYYGGIRLLKAAVKRFHDYCTDNEVTLDERNFTMRYHSNIPHQVGLAGSSAIVTAAFHAMCDFYDVTIQPEILANYVLSVEKDELSISAGLQDRVVQAYESMVYMDFDRNLMGDQGYGGYEPLDAVLLPNIYIAYDATLAERSDIAHNDLRKRYDRGDKDVHEAMAYWADLTDQARDCLKNGDKDKLGGLLNANFDKRREVYPVSPRNAQMVETARAQGASAKFSGSGGAIVGTYEDEAMFGRLAKTFAPMNIQLIKPTII